MDVSMLFETGWRPKYDLKSGLTQAYAWFMEHVERGEARLNVA